MSLSELIQEARALSPDELKMLMQALIEMMPEDAESKQHSITELRGLGKELWQGIDAQAYVNELRSEWDQQL